MKTMKKNKTNEEKQAASDRITLKTVALKEILKALSPFCGEEDSVYGGVQIEAAQGALSFYVTNGSATAKAVLFSRNAIPPADVIRVNFSRLSGFVGVEDSEKDDFANADAEIALEFGAGTLTLLGVGESARRRLKLPGNPAPLLDSSLFDDAGGDGPETTLAFESVESFSEALSAASVSASRKDERASLKGVCLRKSDPGAPLTLYSSDGMRACSFELAYDALASAFPQAGSGGGDTQRLVDATLPLESVSALLKSLRHADFRKRLHVSLESAKNPDSPAQQTFDLSFGLSRGGIMRVRFPASQAAFPRVEDLFAKFTHPATSATCVSADLLRGIVNQARKSLCLKAPDLRLVFSEGDDGEAQELTIADYSGQYSATLPARALLSTPIPEAEREVVLAGDLFAECVAASEASRGGASAPVCLCFNERSPQTLLLTRPRDEKRPFDSAVKHLIMEKRKS